MCITLNGRRSKSSSSLIWYKSVHEPGRAKEYQNNSSTPTMKITVLLPLLECTFGNTLRLVRLSGITGGFEGVAGSGERLEVCTVLLVGL
jgi:hypothetical protein